MKTPRTKVQRVPKGWTHGKTMIDGTWGKEDVEAYFSPSIPGLAVTRTTNGDRPLGQWTVTHIRSGYRIARPSKTIAAACRIANELAPLSDWTRSKLAIRRDKALHERVRKFYSPAVAPSPAPGATPK